MPKSQIKIDSITHYFEEDSDRVFARSELELLFLENRSHWNLPKTMTSRAFIQMLLDRTKLDEIQLRSPHYSSLLRYRWDGKASPTAIALSIKKEKSFFSHASAMWIHGLSDNHKHIFLNKEQSEKRRTLTQLSQEAIDRAFRTEQRCSKLTYRYEGATITILSGKHSGRLEVESAIAPSGHQVEVTSLERTLVDITVRPAYSGGVSSVLQAFRSAKQRISVTKIMAILRKLDHTYPYHQSIGLYLTRAGYADADRMLARASAINFDFYLCHGIKNPKFDPNWKIFYPRYLGRSSGTNPG